MKTFIEATIPMLALFACIIVYFIFIRAAISISLLPETINGIIQ